MEDARIAAMKAREVLDSKARPMVEVDVWTADGIMGRGTSSCGSSVGKHEAVVLRDGERRYGGLGVRRAVKNVMEIIFPAIRGKSVLDQRAIDDLMIELDGTPKKARLGANAIYSVSIAVARAAAASSGVPLYQHLGDPAARVLPVPMFNMVNGGTYPGTRMEIQEFLVIPAMAESYGDALRVGVEIFSVLGDVIKRRHGRDHVYYGPFAGYGAPANEPSAILDTLIEATQRAGYGGRCRVGLDCAASHFYDETRRIYRFLGKEMDQEEMIRFLEELAESYSLFLIEDPLEEDDFLGHAEITARVRSLIVGDDLFVTNLERLKVGVSLGAANAMVLKPNMIGTISEALAAARYANAHGYHVVGSIRGGGSSDDPIPDVAVAAGASLVKFGAPRTGERLNMQNCLLRMEEEMGTSCRYAGARIFGG